MRPLGDLEISDSRRKTGRGGTEYRPIWSFKDRTADFIAAQVATCPRPVVHVCSGASRLGDVKADLVHPRADVRADARNLPFRDVGTVLMDPPWGLDLVTRQRFVTQANLALRPGGVFLLYAPWMPGPLWADLEGAWVRHQRAHRLPGPGVLLTRWRKRDDLEQGARDLELARRRRAAA